MQKIYFMSLLAIFVFISSLSAFNTNAAEKKFDAAQTTMEMERHWEQLIHEKDSEKRKKLIKEHRQMMDKAMKNSGMGSMSMGMHHFGKDAPNDHHRQHMMNTMEMHYMQLDMME